MITFHSARHAGHAPGHEFYRGERVACFESPQRVVFVQQALLAQGHSLREPDLDRTTVLTQVHGARYLGFLQTAWDRWFALHPANATRQPFPSVWPVRGLRRDVKPINFIA